MLMASMSEIALTQATTDHKIVLIIALLIGAALGPRSFAEPYIPSGDTTLLETLTVTRNDPWWREAQPLRSRLSEDPNNIVAAAALARRYVERGLQRSELHLLGFAQVALQPWWSLAEPPVEVAVLRAQIAQHAHQFALAMNELNGVLTRDPGHRQARLTRASLALVRGDLAVARADCRALLRGDDTLYATTCIAAVASRSGALASSRQLLSRLLRGEVGARFAGATWAYGWLAEMARRSGDLEDAEKWLRLALNDSPQDTLNLAALADVLIEQRRYAEAVALLDRPSPPDPLLVRLALAQQAIDPPAARSATAVLQDRFDAARALGEIADLREWSQFLLDIRADFPLALAAAKQNWALQREPEDLILLLRTARQAQDQESLEQARRWLAATHLEDVRIERILSTGPGLGGMR
jgi:Tfp pilus assembly protein PilF